MTNNRRGQASLEFLMTYGWVLITILIVLVVMWQWGLFSMGQNIDPGSFGFFGLVIQNGNEFILHSDGLLEVSFVNNAGANLSIMSYNATIDQQSMEILCLLQNCIVMPGKSWTMQLAKPEWGDSSGRRFDAQIVILYKDNRTAENVYQSSGRIWGNIES
ncbi:MAG: hypothetical protein V1875_02955 [Candidatus Altiarchaeota archaeon]